MEKANVDEDELALSESSGERFGLSRAGEALQSAEQALEARRPLRRSARSRTASGASSGTDASEQSSVRRGRQHRRMIRNPETSRSVSIAPTSSSSTRDSRSAEGAPLPRASFSLRASASEAFPSTNNQRQSLQSSTRDSRSGSDATGEDGAVTDVLSAFGSAKTSRRKREPEKGLFANGDEMPRASQQSKSEKNKKAEDTKRRAPTTSALHQSSSMLHPPAEGVSWEPEVADDDDEEEEYEIESIIKHKAFAGDTYYLVKWVHWPADNESWFTAAELEGAREILEDYLEGVRRRMKKKKKGKGKTKIGRTGSNGMSSSEDGSGLVDEDEKIDCLG
ncbi:hypothetical protein B0J12DRAFT_323030 [Macrophomina phaseolina]|uniref:Chromo domain-containing protein n=1 Tax=Macrophomina phaseolina TaxID=35725 RepID=A0ABQ8FVK2_9PEZI|nr:hypothetical protein B0J12DRAFT_323030 [Macrophomina phaseolina]